MRRAIFTALTGLGLLACGSGSSTQATPSPISGTYVATVMRVTIGAQAPLDLLAGGSSLTITIDASNGTTGTLSIPDSAAAGNGGLTASMTGTATLTGTTVKFVQSADSFIKDLTWTVSGSTLVVLNQADAGSTFTITLTRQ
jgi:hypothetical protein